MKFLLIFFSIALACSLSNASSSSSSSSSDSSSSSSSSESSSSSSSHESSHSRKVKCKYNLWVGDDVDKDYSIEVKSRPGTSFINVMNQAAAKNKRFRFEQTTHPTYGVLINDICGVANNNHTWVWDFQFFLFECLEFRTRKMFDCFSGQYWILYDLTLKPDVYNKPCGKMQSPVGVSELKIVKDHYYLFWYKTNEGVGQCS